MKRFAPLLAVLIVGALSLGCDDAILCDGGICETEAECFNNCEFQCEGEVVDAVCDFEGLCLCECEFQCL